MLLWVCLLIKTWRLSSGPLTSQRRNKSPAPRTNHQKKQGNEEKTNNQHWKELLRLWRFSEPEKTPIKECNKFWWPWALKSCCSTISWEVELFCVNQIRAMKTNQGLSLDLDTFDNTSENTTVARSAALFLSLFQSCLWGDVWQALLPNNELES